VPAIPAATAGFDMGGLAMVAGGAAAAVTAGLEADGLALVAGGVAVVAAIPAATPGLEAGGLAMMAGGAAAVPTIPAATTGLEAGGLVIVVGGVAFWESANGFGGSLKGLLAAAGFSSIWRSHELPARGDGVRVRPAWAAPDS